MAHADKKTIAALRRLEKLEKARSFDPAMPGSEPTGPQRDFLKDIGKYKHRVIRAGNRAGKGATVAREIGWILNDDHPHWNRPDNWGDGPLLILIAGQDRKMMEIELWDKKIALFLDLKEWRQVRVGGSLQYAENRKTKDKIVFLSHADSSEKNRKHMQGYTAHYVWVDEMPSSANLFQEIRARALTYGIFTATFTPKFRSDEIRRVVDSIEPPYGKVYRFSMLDNPMFMGRKEELLAELEGYPEGYKRAVLYGDWYSGDSAVYEWLPESMVQDPDGYSRSWRHVESVDPALKSKFGFTLWAEQPSTGIWFLIRDDYIQGIYSPDDIVQEVRKRTEGFNLVRRISDPHEVWYIGQAAKAGMHYTAPYDKNSRKSELIKGLQHALSSGKIKVAPWCTSFMGEIQGCQWSETAADKIVNSSSYHVLDSAQYFVDCMPKSEAMNHAMPWHEELRQGNKERKRKEKAVKKMQGKSKGQRKIRPIGAWGRSRPGKRVVS